MAKRFGDVPMPLYEDRDLLEELKQGWLLFFQLHEPLADEKVFCIDGSRELSDAFDIDVADGYGLLVELKDGNISLHPAFYDGSSGEVCSRYWLLEIIPVMSRVRKQKWPTTGQKG